MALAKTNTKIYEAETTNELNMQIVSAGNTNAPYSVCFGNGIYAFAGMNEKSIQYSTDGVFFDTAFISFNAYDVIYSNTLEAFLVVGSRTSSGVVYPVIAKTTDFSTFDYLYKPTAIESDIGLIYGIFEIGSRFFALAKSENTQYMFKAVTFSSTFTVDTVKNVNRATYNTSYNYTESVVNIVKGNNRFVVRTVRDNSYYGYYYSITLSGGSYITKEYSNSSKAGMAKLLGFANGFYFAQDGSGATDLYYSIDGLNWIYILNITLSAVVYLNKEYLFIATGQICRRKDIALSSNDIFISYPGLPSANLAVAVNGAAFVLGTNIIKLSPDVPEPTEEAEKLSAKQALKLSKEYSDQLYAALDARVKALEGN